MNDVNKIKAGQTLTCRSVCDSECIFSARIIERTEKTATFTLMGKTRRSKIHADERGEFLMPDRYSMAPIFRA